MKRLIRISIHTLLLCSAMMAKSCVNEDPVTGGGGHEGETAEITFLAGMPAATAVATRGETGSVAENDVSDIYVLAFDKATGNLVYKSKGKNLTAVASSTNSNTHTFTATLPVGELYTFMVLANAEDQLSGINVGAGKKKADVLALTKTETSKWDYTAPLVPMWGEQDLNLTASDTPTFELTRMLARVNVEVKLRDDAQGSPRNNFELTSVRYYNYNTAGTLVPAPGNYDTDAKKATAPTIPQSPGTKTGEALVYDDNVKEITGGESCTETIYIFEAAHNGSTYTSPANNSDWIDNPCLVIGGVYTTDSGEVLDETFYRVDFIKKQDTGNGQVTDKWLDVLRNFSYNVTIVEVSGSGFPDPDVAVKSAPINMEAVVLEWDEGEMGEIVFDGVFYLSVSRDQFVFERGKVDTEQEEYVLYVKTDYVYNNDPSDSNSGWYVEKYVDAADGTTPVNWLQLNPGRGAPDDKVKAYFTFEENPNNTNRSAIVWIAAGRLRYPVYVTQRVLSLYITDPEDNNNPVSEMFFVVPTNLNPQAPRKFDVTWTPVDHDVDITMESPEEWNPFEPDWLFPNPSPTWKITANPSGKESYTITPPTVNQSMIDTDPFYQKETTYYFSVNNGSDEEKKGITLHQIYYNIVVDTYNYQLDGRTYTLSVRSNTDWEIFDIEEWLYNKEPDPANPYDSPILLELKNYDNLRIGTTGGPNISGESLAFTVVNEDYSAHKNKFGTVYVTFINPDNKFEKLRVALTFPPRKMTVLGLGYADTDGGFNVCAPTARHRGCIGYMYSAERNFGLLEESKVKVRDFRLVGFHAESTGSNANGQWNNTRLRQWINEYQPDIIFLTYSILMNTEASKLLVEYMKNGGTVCAFLGGVNDNSGAYVAPFFNQVFEKNLVNTSAGWNMGIGIAGDVFAFPTTSEWTDHPLINGPFGNLNGKFWGSHGNTTGFVPPADVMSQITPLSMFSDCMYTSGINTSRVVSFVHNEYKLFWCGNDCFMGSYYPDLQAGTVSYEWPCQLDSEWNPVASEGHGRSGTTYTKYDVDNSTFMGNLMAWAITNADYKHPAGGY